MAQDKIKYREKLTILKFKDKESMEARKPYEETEYETNNTLLNAGITLLWNLVTGDSAAVFNEANAEIGVGTDETPADPEDNSITGGVWKAMDTGYPVIEDQTITFSGTYEAGDANQDWKEFAVRNGDEVLLNRVVEDKGTKVEGEIWIARLAITLS